jgi:GTP pyrophosphokinase
VPDLILEKITSNASIKKDASYKGDIVVAGCDNILVNIASCCTPVKGDEIVGYITKGNGITVHKVDCINIQGKDARLIDVKWNDTSDKNYTARLLIGTNNINNNLLDIVTKSSQRNLGIESINTINKGEKIDYELLVRVPNTESLKAFMQDIESLEFVTFVERKSK